MTEPTNPTTTRRDLPNVLLSLGDQVVVSATNFATLAMLAKWCGMSTAEVGIYALAMTIFGFLRTAQERMLSNPYLVFVHQLHRDRVTYLGSSLFFQAAFGVASLVIIFLLAFVFGAIGTPAGIAPVLVVLGLGIPFLLLRDHLRAVCAAHLRFEVALVMDVVVAALQLGGLLTLNAFSAVTIPRVAGILGLACLLPTVGCLLGGGLRARMDRTQLQPNWNESWSYSRWLLIARTIGISGVYAIPWLIALLRSEAEAGVFAVCNSLVGLSLMFIMGANNFFQPRAVLAYHQHGLQAMTRALVQATLTIGSILVLISLGFFFAGDWVMSLFGPGYATHGHLLFLLSLSLLSVLVSIICGNGFAAMAQPRGYLWGEFTYFVVALASALWCIPRIGLAGAAIALIAAGLAASIVTSLTLASLVEKARRHCSQPTKTLVASDA